MKIIYLTSDGAKLLKKDNTLVLEKDKKESHTIFPHQTEQIYIIGNINITTPALKLLMKHKIDTVFIGKNGKFYGKLTFTPSKNVFLRVKQYRLLDDKTFPAYIARTIVKAKIKNQITFLRKLYRKKNFTEIKRAIKTLENSIVSVQNLTDVNKIRGVEGIASKTFFSVFHFSFKPDFAIFKGRSKNPPEDNVNAVLSFLYTLLYFRVDAYIEAEGLDSQVGYLHSLDYGRKSLAFDLVEEYRTPIAEALTVTLFNLNILKEDDFREVNFSSKDDEFPLEPDSENEPELVINKRAVLLNNDGLKKVISQFEKRLSSEYFYTPENRKLFYKELIHHQVRHFKRVIIGEEKEYKPLIIK